MLSVTAPARVLIVDDDALALTTLTRYFSKAEDLKVVATASSGLGALNALNELSVDVVLSDIHMPQMNGLELLSRVNELPKIPVFIAITSVDDDKSMLKVLGKGGNGYILKSQTPQSILQAVRDAVRGGKVVSPDSVDSLLASIPETAPSPGAPTLLEKVTEQGSDLSKMEKQVLKLLCQGYNNSEIAERLQYSESSVKRFVSLLMNRFKAASRLELVVRMLNKAR